MTNAKGWRQIPACVWALGFVSLLMDVSSEMIHSVLPVFLLTSLDAGALAIGLIEGAAEATALIVKVFSGAISDYFGKRKGLALAGYGLGALSKPLFALASTVDFVMMARIIDRIGKGIRGAPRDALIADVTPPAIRGAAFGLRQSLDTVGAFLGPLLAVYLLWIWQGDFRAIFWIAVIPGLLSVLVLLFGVEEPVVQHDHPCRNPISMSSLRLLPSAFWWVVGFGVVFTLARFSEAFLLLRAEQGHISTAFIPLFLVAMNLVYALAAYPFGQLADRINPRWLLAIGLSVLIAADTVMAASEVWLNTLCGVLLWGLHMGMTQGLLAKMVADTAPAWLRGTAFGLFNLMSGLAMLFASAFAGWLWERWGAAFTFAAGAVFCVLALLLLGFMSTRVTQKA